MRRNAPLEQYSLIFLLLTLFILMLMPFIQGLLLGFFAAFAFYPGHLWLSDKLFKLSKGSRALISTLLLVLFIIVPIFLVGLAISKDVLTLFGQSEKWMTAEYWSNSALGGLLERYAAYVPGLTGFSLDSKFFEILTEIGAFLAKVAASLVGSLPGYFLQVLLFILAFYYALVDGPRMYSFLLGLLPFEKMQVQQLSRVTQNIAFGVLFGSLVAGIVQATIMGAGFWALGVPKALIVAFFTLILTFIPFIGSSPAGIGGIIYLLTQNEPWMAFIMAIIYCIAMASDNIVKPWVLSRGGSPLHPLLGLTSALGGLALFGFLGIFLGPMICALVIAVLKLLKDSPGICSKASEEPE